MRKEPLIRVDLTPSEIAFTIAVLKSAALFHPPDSPVQQKTQDVVDQLEGASA